MVLGEGPDKAWFEHISGSETSLLERSWTLFYVGVVPGEGWSVVVGLSIAPQLSSNVLECTPVDERVDSLCLRVWELVLRRSRAVN